MAIGMKKGPKDNSRRRRMPEQWDKSRREAAMARQEVSSKRTPEAQLARLDAAGHRALKERAKIAKKILKNSAPKADLQGAKHGPKKH